MLFSPEAGEKLCARCGTPIVRKVMETAKYCSGECRQAAAMEAYKARERKKMRLTAASMRGKTDHCR